MTLSQHSWAEGCAWGELERRGQAPILYVANGSHAIYSLAGEYDRPFPDPADEAGGDGYEVRPDVTAITDRDPGWVRYEGSYHAAVARPCHSGAPGRPWHTAAIAGGTALALAAMALGLLRALRRTA